MQPSPIHRSLKTNGKRRVIVVGDVHGCLDELKALLIGMSPPYEQEKDVLIFVGDLVAKGPDSCGVVTFAREMGALSIMGNWEVKALKKYDELSTVGSGIAKVKKKLAFMKDLSAEDVMWLKDLPYTITLPDLGFIVVHAGLVPGRSLRDQTLDDMCNMRSVLLTANGGFLTSNGGDDCDGVPWAEHWVGPPHVIFGHDKKRGLQLCKSATGLDTGCAKGGSLTACVLPSKELYFVKNGEKVVGRLVTVNSGKSDVVELDRTSPADHLDGRDRSCTVQ